MSEAGTYPLRKHGVHEQGGDRNGGHGRGGTAEVGYCFPDTGKSLAIAGPKGKEQRGGGPRCDEAEPYRAESAGGGECAF